MCGIAGWYRRGGKPVSETLIRAQCDAIRHRGPDDAGLLCDGDFGMGMRRLSIVDVPGGHQPMRSEDGRYTIVYNGEVYNHLALRLSLGGMGRFKTHSDTETVLAAFAEWGNACWEKLEGMFAVAVWDHLTRQLTLARDPLGIKPLYVSRQQGGVAFGSELKSLRKLSELDFTMEDRSVHDFFTFGHVRKPRSIFSQVNTLEPGHWLTIGPIGDGQSGRYWKPTTGSRSGSIEELTSELRAMLLDTTARHMMADVPVGAFLSGGIDSSAVLAAMTRATNQKVKAFTIGYPGARIDESAAASRIAEHLGCEHVVLPLAESDLADVLPDVVKCFDEPFADMAAIPTWWASRLAAEHVKVVLCGEGGDELFAGYKRHRNAALIERYRPIMGPAGKAAAAVGSAMPGRSAQLNYLRQHAERFSEFAGLADGYQQFFAATQISARRVRRRVYSHDFAKLTDPHDDFCKLEEEFVAHSGGRGSSALDQFLLADLTLNMPSAMLTRLDRASMAHSLEARVPLLSHKMVDWALSVPVAMKMRGRTGKAILRDAVAPWLPRDVMKRPKQGFQIPYRHWFQGSLGEFARETWRASGAASANYLDPEEVEKLFDEHRRGEADHGRMLYAITVFALWWNGAHDCE